MKKVYLFIFLTFVATSQSYAQQVDARQTTIDAGVSVGKGTVLALSAQKLYGFGKAKRFKAGFGLRVSSASGSTLKAETAPYAIRKDPTKIDTLNLSKFGVIAINASIHLQYSLSQKIDVGFNIDAIGASFGGQQSGIFKLQKTGTLNKTTQTAKPTSLNVLLVGDNDIGTLNSEFYGRYWITDNLGIRAGLNYQFIEYTTTKVLTNDNDRFRGKLAQPFVAISYKF